MQNRKYMEMLFNLQLLNNPGVCTCLDLHVSLCSVHLQTAVFTKSQLSGRAWPGRTKSNRTESLMNDFGWMVQCATAQLGCRNVVGNYHVLWCGKCLPEESIMASAMIITCFSNQTQNMINTRRDPITAHGQEWNWTVDMDVPCSNAKACCLVLAEAGVGLRKLLSPIFAAAGSGAHAEDLDTESRCCWMLKDASTCFFNMVHPSNPGCHLEPCSTLVKIWSIRRWPDSCSPWQLCNAGHHLLGSRCACCTAGPLAKKVL